MANLTPDERLAATVYTSGEHCPMCAAGARLGRPGTHRVRHVERPVDVSGCAEWGAPPSPVAPLPINTVAPGVAVDGPAPELADDMKALYEAKFRP